MSVSTPIAAARLTINTDSDNTLRICMCCGLVAGARPNASMYLRECMDDDAHDWEYVSGIYIAEPLEVMALVNRFRDGNK